MGLSGTEKFGVMMVSAGAALTTVGILTHTLVAVDEGAALASLIPAGYGTYKIMEKLHRLKSEGTTLKHAVAEKLRAHNPIAILRQRMEKRKTMKNTTKLETPLANQHSIVYPIDIDNYRSYWNDWDILREFISNAIDAEKGDWKRIGVTIGGSKLTISNSTKSLKTEDLYLGHSSQGKSTDGAYIGRFNEGMKLALMTAIRKGYGITIRFGDKVVKPQAVISENMRVLKIDIGDADAPITGTVVELTGINDAKLSKLFAEKVLTPNDKRIAYSVGNGFFNRSELKRGIFDYTMQVTHDNNVYIGGMFVSAIKGYAWGYNFNPKDVPISEGRNIFDSVRLDAVLWREMQNVDSTEYWTKIFKAIKNGDEIGEARQRIQTDRMDSGAKKAISAAWNSVFGKNAVVVRSYDDDIRAEVEYIGGKAVNSTPLLGGLMQAKVLPSASEFIETHFKGKLKIFDKEELNERERYASDILAQIAERHSGYEFMIYKAYRKNGNDEMGITLHGKKMIGIRREILLDYGQATNTLMHEIAHAEYKTKDATAEHVDAVGDVAVDMLYDEKSVELLKKLKDVCLGKVSQPVAAAPDIVTMLRPVQKTIEPYGDFMHGYTQLPTYPDHVVRKDSDIALRASSAPNTKEKSKA